jgi:ABC-2 type transport system permease protein
MSLAHHLKVIYRLTIARNKEFYRDKGSITWAILFPVLLMTGITFAFRNEDQELFKVGLLGDNIPVHSESLLEKSWVTLVHYADDETGTHKAFERIRHHELDLLLKADGEQLLYWVNPQSSRGAAAEQLLLATKTLRVKQTIEGRAIRYVDWVIPGVLGMNIMFGALFGIGYVIVRYRKMEVLKRIQATPVSAVEYLSAQIISRLLVMLLISSVIFAACNWTLDFVVEGSYGLLFLIALLGGFAMVSLGLVMSSRTDSEELAGGLLNFATFPMMLLSEVWFSLDGSPAWMQTLSQALPLTHMVSAARKVMLEGATLGDIGLHLSILGCMSVVCLMLAACLFRWSKS